MSNRPGGERSADPLYRDVVLGHVVELPVLGIPVRFECSAPRAAERVEAAYGAWRRVLGRGDLLGNRRVRVRIVVVDGGAPEPAASGLHSFMPDNDRLLVHAPGGLALADAPRAEGIIYATQALLGGETFVDGMLDAIVLLLVTHFDRMPVHAAMLVRDGCALLLAAPSGTGKSTLAYAALRSGYSVSADDVTYVQLIPHLRAWGAARALRLPVDLTRWFPELASVPPSLGPDGEKKIAMALQPGRDQPLPVAERTGVCLLARGDQPAPRLEAISPAAAAALLSTDVEPGFDRFADRLQGAWEALGRRGSWRLMLPVDPTAATPFIQDMFRQLSE